MYRLLRSLFKNNLNNLDHFTVKSPLSSPNAFIPDTGTRGRIWFEEKLDSRLNTAGMTIVFKLF